MKIQEAKLPREIKDAIPDLLLQVAEYLDLEEGTSPKDLRYSSFLTLDNSTGFVIFDYTAEEGSSFAFFQFSLARGAEHPGCIGCWPRTDGQTLTWSIAEYLQMNPIGDE